MRARNFMLMVIGAGIAAILVFFTFVAASCRPRISAQEVELGSTSAVTTSEDVTATLISTANVSVISSTLEIDNKSEQKDEEVLFGQVGVPGLYAIGIEANPHSNLLSPYQIGEWINDEEEISAVLSHYRGTAYAGMSHLYVGFDFPLGGMLFTHYEIHQCPCAGVRAMRNLTPDRFAILYGDYTVLVRTHGKGARVFGWVFGPEKPDPYFKIRAMATNGTITYLVFGDEILIVDLSGEELVKLGSIPWVNVDVIESAPKGRGSLWIAKGKDLIVLDANGEYIASWIHSAPIRDIRANGDYVVITTDEEVFVTTSSQIHRSGIKQPQPNVRLVGNYTTAELSRNGLLVATRPDSLEVWDTGLDPDYEPKSFLPPERVVSKVFLPFGAQPVLRWDPAHPPFMADMQIRPVDLTQVR